MSVNDWLSVILSTVAILGVFLASGRWIIRHYLKDILAELKPNGGASTKDKINKLEIWVKRIDEAGIQRDKKLDKMYDILLEYIAKKS